MRSDHESPSAAPRHVVVGPSHRRRRCRAGTAARARAERTEPFKGVTTNGTVHAGSLPDPAPPACRRRRCATRRTAFLAALTPEQRGKTAFAVDDRRMAQVEQRASLRAAGRQLQGDDRARSARGVRSAAGGAQREGAREVAQHHAAQRDDRRDDEAVRRVWRRPLQPHRHGRAVGHDAVGLAARRPSPDHQLLRAAAIRW